MYHSKLIQLYQTLTTEEKKGIGKWIKTPFCKANTEITLLWNYLNKITSFSPQNTNKEVLFKIAFPKKEYKDAAIRLIMTHLTNGIMDYLSWNYLNKNPLQKQWICIKEQQQRGMKKFAIQLIQEYKETLLEKAYLNQDWLYNDYQRELTLQELVYADKRDKNSNLQITSDKLDTFYIAAKLQLLNTTLCHSQIYNINYDIHLQEEILAAALLPMYASNRTIEVYYWACQVLLNNTDDVYTKFRDKLLHFPKSILPDQEIGGLYITAINYCIKRINTGNEQYRVDVFELYKNGIEKRFLYENNLLSRFTYNNAVTIALRIGKYDWVKEFIEKYKPDLEEDNAEFTYQYNLSKYHFSIGNYKEVIKQLYGTDFEDKLLNLDAKVVLMKSLFQVKEYDLLENVIDSFRVYMSRQELVGYHKNNYSNILSIIRKLLAYYTRPSTSEYNKLIKLITESYKLTERSWFLEALQSLK